MIASALLAMAAALFQDLPSSERFLALACGQRGGEVALTIHNSGRADTALRLGISFANGRWYLPNQVIIELTRTGGADVEDLRFRGPRMSPVKSITGSLNFLRARRLRCLFYSEDFGVTSAVPRTTPPEQLRVRLEGQPITSDLNVNMTGMKAWRLWTGLARSNAIRISDCSP